MSPPRAHSTPSGHQQQPSQHHPVIDGCPFYLRCLHFQNISSPLLIREPKDYARNSLWNGFFHGVPQ